ncbi:MULTISPECIES: alpha/beta fold hydrolase [Hafnia]|uniref:alpha/beta fold hydrolase n=1 Tax=Hafnia TaxID=568 RepID=UPI0024BBBC9F|nr:alpha/beta fold hydrolase [Hafnia paralvei]
MTTPSSTASTTMSSHFSVIHRYFAAFGSGNIDVALALMTDDVIWHIDGELSVSTVGILRGREQVRGWLETFPSDFKPQEFTVSQLFESGDTVLALGRFRHTVLTTGNIIGSDYVIRFEMREGLIAHYQIFEDSALLARAFDPADRFEQQRIRINGNVYAYTDVGTGPTIIFAHGLFLDRSSFDQQVAMLSQNYRCIVLDMPGHGESGVFPPQWTLDDIANDIALLVQVLALGKVILVGQSQGGMMGIRLAALHPDVVSHLILVGTSARAEFAERITYWNHLLHIVSQGAETERMAAFEAVQKRLCPAQWLSDNPELAKHEIDIMLSHDRVGIAHAIAAATINRTDVRDLLKKITIPTLVVCGEQDQATPLMLSQEMADLIPNATLHVLAHVGHHPQLEEGVALLSAMERFLHDKDEYERKISVRTGR